MNRLLLHPDTAMFLEQFVSKPTHALLLLGPSGAGKRTLGLTLAARLLGIDSDNVNGHPYFKAIAPPAGKSISIDSVREITHFLMLRTTKKSAVTRVVLIENAGAMTVQAQNALLKTIEEPPQGTVLVLTAPNELDILPTIRSRVQSVTIKTPEQAALQAYFLKAGFGNAAIGKALMMSDGLPGLTQALLSDDTSHPLVIAATQARDILQKPTFERLLLIDDLVKQKQAWLDVLFIIQRMAEINLRKAGASQSTLKRWHSVLSASHEAYGKTLVSAQMKLVALQFMLSI